MEPNKQSMLCDSRGSDVACATTHSGAKFRSSAVVHPPTPARSIGSFADASRLYMFGYVRKRRLIFRRVCFIHAFWKVDCPVVVIATRNVVGV